MLCRRSTIDRRRSLYAGYKAHQLTALWARERRDTAISAVVKLTRRQIARTSRHAEGTAALLRAARRLRAVICASPRRAAPSRAAPSQVEPYRTAQTAPGLVESWVRDGNRFGERYISNSSWWGRGRQIESGTMVRHATPPNYRAGRHPCRDQSGRHCHRQTLHRQRRRCQTARDRDTQTACEVRALLLYLV